MKPHIRKMMSWWACGSCKETLEYFIDWNRGFDSLDNTKIQAVGQGSSPTDAYQEWVKSYQQSDALLVATKKRYSRVIP